MKIIVCTGDSHTCGQGADSIRTKYKPKNPNNIYNTAGKGISRGGNLAHPCYVNLLRESVKMRDFSLFLIRLRFLGNWL